MDSKRSFTIIKAKDIDYSAIGGRFVSEKPSLAAPKAASRLFKKIEGLTDIHFTLEETTRGSERGRWTVHAMREKLANPKTYTIGDKVITHEFKTKIVSMDVAPKE